MKLVFVLMLTVLGATAIAQDIAQDKPAYDIGNIPPLTKFDIQYTASQAEGRYLEIVQAYQTGSEAMDIHGDIELEAFCGCNFVQLILKDKDSGGLCAVTVNPEKSFEVISSLTCE